MSADKHHNQGPYDVFSFRSPFLKKKREKYHLDWKNIGYLRIAKAYIVYEISALK